MHRERANVLGNGSCLRGNQRETRRETWSNPSRMLLIMPFIEVHIAQKTHLLNRGVKGAQELSGTRRTNGR